MTSNSQSFHCPQCGSTKLWRDGKRYVGEREIQRWICRNCGFRFSETKLNHRNMLERFETVHRQNLKTTTRFTINRRVSVPKHRTKNSASIKLEKAALASIKNANPAATTKKPTPQEINGKIIEYSWWLHKQGYAESTIIGRTKLLKILAKRGANLFDPETVKETIAKQKWSAGRKVNAVDAYTSFLTMLGMKWDPPKYKRVYKLPFIPTETELDQLIAGCGRRTATLLQLLKETGMRIGEAWKLKWTDIDFVKRTVRVTPEKGSNPRIFKLSSKLIAMLSALQAKTNRNKVFGKSLKSQEMLFYKQRKRIANKLKNPRILRITFHTFRHWKATMEYQRTRDILYVMKLLGHKNINNTLKYTQLVDFKDDEYVSKVAKTVEEACQLVEAGFEYVCEMDGVKIFRKRK